MSAPGDREHFVGSAPSDVWTALIEVRPFPGNPIFEGAPGAFTNVAGLASGQVEFEWRVQQAMAAHGLKVVECSEVERIDRLVGERPGEELPAETLDLIGQLSAESPVAYDTFYIYKSDED